MGLNRPMAGTVVFLGGGRISTAMIHGLQRSGYAGPVMVHDHDAKKLRAIHRTLKVSVEPDLTRAVDQAHILVFAVRPASAPELLNALRQFEKKNKPRVAISVMAGIRLEWLRKQLGPHVSWVRALPSPASESGNGLTALAFDSNCTVAGKRQARRLFSQLGAVTELREKDFDAF